jgi:organic radical activating enzyme
VWDSTGNTILDKWHSDDLEALRGEFLADQQSAICNRCWNEEASGKRSLRLRLFDPVNKTTDYHYQADSIKQLISSQSYLSGPTVLTIKNGNICNAKCRVCHPGDSNRWIADATRLQEITGRQYYAIDQQERNWSDEQLAEILAMSKNLTRLELFGGEPVYNKQVARLLEQIVSAGYADNITLYINTNGSVDLVDRMPCVRYFKEIEIGVSIDGVGAHFDYIRHGLQYETVKQNIRIWQEYFEQHNVRYFIDSISTVEILNIFYLPELKQAVQDILPLSPYWNLLVDPAYLFIRNMPDSIKQAVSKKLEPDPEFADLLTTMNQPADLNEWAKFLEVTQALDAIRGESFEQTFPEFSTLVKNSNK